MSATNDVVLELLSPAAIIRLDRYHRRNALTMTMLRTITSMVNELEQDPDVAGIIITGNNSCFSAGADLEEAIGIVTPKHFDIFSRAWREMCAAIENSMKPVIACIEGVCFTGGLELALACDYRIAGRGSSFAMTSARIGSVAGAGGTQRLPRTVPLGDAKRMLLLAEPIDADEAYRIGLLQVLVPAGESLEQGLKDVDILAERGPLSLGWHKRAVNVGLNGDLESGLSLEAVLSSYAFGTKDKIEGMRAFLDKRAPKFIGE